MAAALSAAHRAICRRRSAQSSSIRSCRSLATGSPAARRSILISIDRSANVAGEAPMSATALAPQVENSRGS